MQQTSKTMQDMMSLIYQMRTPAQDNNKIQRAINILKTQQIQCQYLNKNGQNILNQAVYFKNPTPVIMEIMDQIDKLGEGVLKDVIFQKDYTTGTRATSLKQLNSLERALQNHLNDSIIVRMADTVQQLDNFNILVLTIGAQCYQEETIQLVLSKFLITKEILDRQVCTNRTLFWFSIQKNLDVVFIDSFLEENPEVGQEMFSVLFNYIYNIIQMDCTLTQSIIDFFGVVVQQDLEANCRIKMPKFIAKHKQIFNLILEHHISDINFSFSMGLVDVMIKEKYPLSTIYKCIDQSSRSLLSLDDESLQYEEDTKEIILYLLGKQKFYVIDSIKYDNWDFIIQGIESQQIRQWMQDCKENVSIELFKWLVKSSYLKQKENPNSALFGQIIEKKTLWFQPALGWDIIQFFLSRYEISTEQMKQVMKGVLELGINKEKNFYRDMILMSRHCDEILNDPDLVFFKFVKIQHILYYIKQNQNTSIDDFPDNIKNQMLPIDEGQQEFCQICFCDEEDVRLIKFRCTNEQCINTLCRQCITEHENKCVICKGRKKDTFGNYSQQTNINEFIFI